MSADQRARKSFVRARAGGGAAPARVFLITLGACIAGGCASAPLAPSARHVAPVAAVATDHPLASEAGAAILRRGGNAVDAAVAASFALSVVRPYSCGIGGGGFMLIHRPGAGGAPAETIALNYRETAPGGVGPEYYTSLDGAAHAAEASRFGAHAVGVPGTVAGLLLALEGWGTLDRAVVLAPAIALAEGGFPADASHVSAAESVSATLSDRPHLRPAFEPLWRGLCHGGTVQVGDRLTNPLQARALRLIAQHGRGGFYEGRVAEAIAAAVEAGGGALSLDDLRRYEPRVVEPLRGAFREWTMLSMPPPSSGGIAMQQVLGLLDRRWEEIDGAQRTDPDFVHLLAEAMKHAFADRARWLADPEHVDVPVAELLDPAYLDALAARIDTQQTRPAESYGRAAPLPVDGGTSHLSVIDSRGMAVACTETINLEYGSLVAVSGFGFALNNEMDDFTTRPGEPNAFGLRQSDRNLPAPGKRPLSSMSPTIVLDDRGRAILVAGASGGPRIISATLQCVLGSLLFGLDPAAAVAAPRVHHQWMPNVLQFEAAWADHDLVQAMRERGHRIGQRAEIGVVQLVRVNDEGAVEAASDPRKGGAPAYVSSGPAPAPP